VIHKAKEGQHDGGKTEQDVEHIKEVMARKEEKIKA
jgi:hypothetical protein